MARLREATQKRIQVNNAAPVPRRLAWALCLLGERYGVPVADGLLIDVPLSQADIASLISTSEQSVRKALSGLRDEGVVRWTYRKTVITDLERLQQIAESARAPRAPGNGRAAPVFTDERALSSADSRIRASLPAYAVVPSRSGAGVAGVMPDGGPPPCMIPDRARHRPSSGDEPG